MVYYYWIVTPHEWPTQRVLKISSALTKERRLKPIIMITTTQEMEICFLDKH